MWLPRGREGRGEMEWEIGISRCKLLHIEWIDNKVYHIAQGAAIFTVL